MNVNIYPLFTLQVPISTDKNGWRIGQIFKFKFFQFLVHFIIFWSLSLIVHVQYNHG